MQFSFFQAGIYALGNVHNMRSAQTLRSGLSVAEHHAITKDDGVGGAGRGGGAGGQTTRPLSLADHRS